MKLPAIPFLTRSVSTEYFLALIFESDKISSILFKEEDKLLKILGSHETLIHSESAEAEDLVVACDNVISRVEMSLPEGETLEKTIFAVPYSWVEEGKIRPERLSNLKKISTELALVPMGFIVSIEAIVAFLQKKEGAPVSGIFVELAEKSLAVFIVRGGNIIDVKSGEIVEGVEATVEELLSKVTKLDVLPSKIVLLHNKEAEIVSQKFLSHHWTKELSFMHLPQVAILERGFENEAIINGVASQLNVAIDGDINVATVAVADDEDHAISISSGDTFGFVQDVDVAQKEPEKSPPLKREGESDDDLPSFKEEEVATPIVRHNGIVKADNAEEVYEEDVPVDDIPTSASARGGMLAPLGAFFTPRSFARFPKMIGGGRKLLIPFIAFIAVIAVVALYYSVILKAEVAVVTDQKAFKEDSLDITLTTNGASSFSDKTLKISTVDQEVTGEQLQETTGTKDTGQKAAGSITIFNKTEGPKQLDKGAVLISSNNLEFTLNDNVSIASTSSFSTSFSNVSAKVSASSFGKEFNLPSGTNFTIKGVSSSDLFGRNDSAFSGGTKEEIQVVAKKDLSALEETITERLFDKAKSQAENELQADEALIPVSLSTDFKDQKYDRKENDQAKTVKLNATVTYILGIYKKDELTKFISSSNDFDVPKEFRLDDSESSIKITDIEQNGTDLSAKLSFTAVFKPQLDTSKLPGEISGKGKDAAIEKLKSIPGISDALITFPNAFPFMPTILPMNKANITITAKTQ